MMRKILIVEDDQNIRELYSEVLTNEGYDVEIAVDGEEGLVKAKKGGYEIILLDVMMPKVDGIHFLQEIKNIRVEQVNGKIILLTNLAHDEIVDQAISLGAYTYLIKSDITPTDLIKKVNSLIGSS